MNILPDPKPSILPSINIQGFDMLKATLADVRDNVRMLVGARSVNSVVLLLPNFTALERGRSDSSVPMITLSSEMYISPFI